MILHVGNALTIIGADGEDILSARHDDCGSYDAVQIKCVVHDPETDERKHVSAFAPPNCMGRGYKPDHVLAIITGDTVKTAVHYDSQCGICPNKLCEQRDRNYPVLTRVMQDILRDIIPRIISRSYQ